MKSRLLVLCAMLLLAGCESVSTRVQDRFATVAPKVQLYAAERKVVFHAAQQAVKDSGLLLGSSSLAKGRVSGYAPIRQGDAMHDTRQTTLEVTITEVDAGTEVAVLVQEHTEGGFPGGVSEQNLREHSLYALYFSVLQQLLQPDTNAPAVVKR